MSRNGGGFLLMCSMILVLVWNSFLRYSLICFFKWLVLGIFLREWRRLHQGQQGYQSIHLSPKKETLVTIYTLSNVAEIGAGIQLASTIYSSVEGKLVVGSILSVVHVFSVVEQMRGVPINTLYPQRTPLIVANFLSRMVKFQALLI